MKIARKKVLAAAALLCVFSESAAFAEEPDDRPKEPGSFKSRVIEILKNDPFSRYYVKRAPEAPKELNFIPPEPKIAHSAASGSARRPEGKSAVSVTEDRSLDLFEDNEESGKTLLYTYTRGKSYDVYCAPGYLTDIELAQGESLESVRIGDAAAWSAELKHAPADNTWHLYVKPLTLGVTTNMAAVTDKHSYMIRLIADKDYTPVVAWTYPGETKNVFQPEGVKLEVDSVSDLNFDYRITQAKKYLWAPETVFDDGVKTYLLLNEKAAAKYRPLVFARRQGGQLIDLEYRAVNNMIILNRVFDELLLRVNESSAVEIKNTQKESFWK